MTNINIFLFTINRCSIAIYKTIKEVRKSYVFCQINNELNT